MLGEPARCEDPQAALLALINGASRRPEPIACPRLHLNENDEVAHARLPSDEIELAGLAAPVAIDDLELVTQIPRCGLILAPAPARLAR